MDIDAFRSQAERIIGTDGDGAAGVALILADHNRLLATLRNIYDAGAPARVAEQPAVQILEGIRDRSLAGLRMPATIQGLLGLSPSATFAQRPDLQAPSDRQLMQTQSDRIRELEEELGVSDARVDALEEEARKLVGALTEYGDFPWWLRAAAAFNELSRLAVDRDGV